MIIYIFLIFPSFLNGDCLQRMINDTQECFACTFSFYNENYYSPQTNLLNCSSKLNENYTRKILILNSICENCNQKTYDKIYFNISEAFSSESLIAMKYLYSNLTFYFMDGYHFIKNNVPQNYFRQTLVDLTLISINPMQATLCFINEKFSLFISKVLKIIDINITGRESFKNESEFLSDSLLKDQFSALINVEKILDYEKEDPIVIILNFTIYVLHEFDTIINLVSPFGSIILENLNISDCKFKLSFIYYFSNEGKFEYILKSVNGKIEQFQINPTKFNFTINNSTFKFENVLENQVSLLFLVNINCSILMMHNRFEHILSNDHLFYIENSKQIGEIKILNSDFFEIKAKTIFSAQNISNFYLENFNLISIECSNSLFQIKKCSFFKIANFNLSNFSSDFFLMADQTFVNIEEILLFDLKIGSFLFQTSSSDFFMFNSTFNEIQIGESLFYMEKFLDMIISLCQFIRIKSTDYIFLIQTANSLFLYDSKIHNCSCFALFFLDQVQKHLNERIIFAHNVVSLTWMNEYRCKNISLFNSEIKMNFFKISFSSNFGMNDMVLYLKNMTIIGNEMNSTCFMMWLAGFVIFQNLKFIENIALNEKAFVFVFDIELNSLYINGSYFENNGLRIKKTYYISFIDNNLFFFWKCIFIKIDSSFFMASNKTNLPSGFLAAIPLGDIIEINNCVFVLMDTENSDNMYKGVMLENFNKASLTNNQFFNLKCNNRAFATQHGSIFLSGASTYIVTKNEIFLSMINNSFINCHCDKGGSLAIININNVTIENCYFFNSSAISLGGSFFIISCFHIRIENIYIRNSSSIDTSAFYLKNIITARIFGFIGINCFSYQTKVVSLENINFIIIRNGYAHNSFSNDKGGIFYVYNTYLQLIIGFFSNTFCLKNGGTFFINGKSNVIIRNVSSLKSEAENGGFIYVQDCIKFKLLDSFVSNAASFQNGGVIFAINFDESMINNLYLIKCISTEAGIILILNQEEKSHMTIDSLECHETIASIGSCIFSSSSGFLKINQLTIDKSGALSLYFFSSVLTDLALNQIIVRNNNVKSSILYLENKNFDLSYINILSNSLNEYLIGMKYCKANITYLNSHENIDQAIIYVEFSKIMLNYLFVDKNLNIILISLNCSILLSNSNFLSQVLFDSQNYFFECTKTLINIEKTLFYKSFGNAMKVSQSNLIFDSFIMLQIVATNDLHNLFQVENILKESKIIKISKSYFNTNNSSLFFVVGFFNIEIDKCIFKNLKDKSVDLFLFAFFIENTGKEIKIINSTFSNFTESSVTIKSSNEWQGIYIISCNFTNNRAFKGSSLLFEGLLRTEISHCFFVQNEATLGKRKDQVGGIGACIFFNGFFQENKMPEITIISNIFKENFAQNIIPTIFSNIPPFCNELNLFIDNYDGVNFTNTFSTFPIKIRPNIDSQEYTRIPVFSGHEFVLSFSIYDYLEQKLIFDSDTVFTMKNEDINNSSFLFIKNNVATSYNGDIIFNHLKINGYPGSNFNLSLIASSLTTLPSPSISVYFEFFILNCSIGNILKPDFTCFQCPSSTFSLQDPISTAIHLQQCLLCPKNALCFDGFMIVPLPGFYKYNQFSKSVVECLARDACIGNHCLKGNTGRLCAECISGWGKEKRENVCLQCDMYASFVKMMGTSIIIIIYILLIFATAEGKRKTHQIEHEEIRMKGYLKLITAHIQQIIVLINRRAIFDFRLEAMTGWLEIFSFTNDDLMSNDCLLKNIFPSNYNKFVAKNLIISTFPILFALLCFILWSLYQSLKKTCKQSDIIRNLYYFLEGALKRLIILSIISIFLFYTVIIKSNFLIFNCLILDTNIPETFFIDDLNLSCWNSKHLELVFTFGIPTILIWGGLFPLFLYKILKLKLKKSSAYKTKNEKEDNELANNEVFEFFYKDYKEKQFYWEDVIFIKKFLIYLVCSFNETLYSEVKSLALLTTLLFFLSLTMAYNPYKTKALNKLELFSLFILVYTVALFTIADNNLTYELKGMFLIIFLIINIAFFCFLLISILRIMLLKLTRLVSIKKKRTKVDRKKKKLNFKDVYHISYGSICLQSKTKTKKGGV